MNFISKNIYYDDFFDFFIKKNSIIIKLKKDNNLLISSWHNGGYNENIKHVVNQSLEGQDYLNMEKYGYGKFQELYFKELGFDSQNTVGITTSACMDNYGFSIKQYENLKVVSIVTAGADKNGIKAGDSASFYEYNNYYFKHFGTINIITIINANLEAGALVTAGLTITEAKTSVLQDLKVESQFSTNIATGTGTDGYCIISNKESNNHIENAGKHSKLGELIAKSVQDATKKALYLQTAICEEYQKTVLSRLSRFNIDFDDLLYLSNLSEIDYVKNFYNFNNNPKNVAFVSLIINLIDEVQVGLLDLDDVQDMVKSIIFSHLHIDVSDKIIEKNSDILELLIKSINQYLEKIVT